MDFNLNFRRPASLSQKMLSTRAGQGLGQGSGGVPHGCRTSLKKRIWGIDRLDFKVKFILIRNKLNHSHCLYPACFSNMGIWYRLKNIYIYIWQQLVSILKLSLYRFITNKVQNYEDEMNYIYAKYSGISWLSAYHTIATEKYTSGLRTKSSDVLFFFFPLAEQLS